MSSASVAKREGENDNSSMFFLSLSLSPLFREIVMSFSYAHAVWMYCYIAIQLSSVRLEYVWLCAIAKKKHKLF